MRQAIKDAEIVNVVCRDKGYEVNAQQLNFVDADKTVQKIPLPACHIRHSFKTG